MIAPQTNIQLMTTVLSETQENQLTFPNVEAQNDYFEGLPKLSAVNCTYQRKDQTIRFEGKVDSLRQYNYVRYKNAEFGNKWFYAFITSMEYVGEEVTAIRIKTDVYQTWMFDITLKPSFIEREHVTEDGFAQHTIPEGLEFGDYVVQEFIPMYWADSDHIIICLQVSDFPSNVGISDTPVRLYNGMPSGCYYLVFDKDKIEGVNKWINAYVKDGKQDAILAIFPIPFRLAFPRDESTPTQAAKLINSIFDETYIFIESDKPVKMDSVAITPSYNEDFDGYYPKNKKLYIYPYCYFYLNTFTGSTVEYHYEQFDGPQWFTIWGSISAGGEFKVVPQFIYGAGGEKGSYGFGMSLASMPQGSWNSSTYQNWRALNMDAIAIEAERDALSSGIADVGRALNLDVLGVAQSAVDYNARVKQRFNQERVASKMPNQARGDVATQSLNFSLGYADGGFYRMRIRREYAEIIDKYFTAFGYRVNEFKTPNINTRKYFNYIKTIELNVTGRLPQDDLVEIKNIFNRGITFWHDPNYFLNYDVDNSII